MDQPKGYRCHVCGARFITSSELEEHNRQEHNKQDNFENAPDLDFKEQDNLDIHNKKPEAMPEYGVSGNRHSSGPGTHKS